LGFFCPEPQCWRGFQLPPLERSTSIARLAGVKFSVFLSLFSVYLLTGQAIISSTGAGLPLLGCGFHLAGKGDQEQ
jgi:hypothetical protein